jgi:hypothetical protein
VRTKTLGQIAHEARGSWGTFAEPAPWGELHQWQRDECERMAVAVAQACAAACDDTELRHWNAYKTGHGPERGSDYTQGKSDGASECAAALRGLVCARDRSP